MLAPPEGFIWAATSHFGSLFIRGFDRYTRGTGQLRWRILGRIPFLSVTGSDVSRSAMGRPCCHAIVTQIPDTGRVAPGAAWKASGSAYRRP